jgi:hypothetical protein
MDGRSVQLLLQEIDAVPVKDGGRIAAFGGASGAEFRGTSTLLPEPFTMAASSPEGFMVLIHFLNMHGAPSAKDKRFECPCTSHTKIDAANGTVNGLKVRNFTCSQQLIDQGNSGCSLETYKGGYRCCENNFFLSADIPGPDVPATVFQAKYTFSYIDEDVVEEARPVALTSCCDATGDLTVGGNLEYSVPQCAPGTAPEFCEYVLSTVQKLDHGRGVKVDPEEVIELVHAWGHQHVGGLGMELYNEQTGQLLCRTAPKYGSGFLPGDEDGYVVGIPPCVWGSPPLAPPPRLRRKDLVRTVARYNSTQERHGVMSLWIMSAAPALTNRDDMYV